MREANLNSLPGPATLVINQPDSSCLRDLRASLSGQNMLLPVSSLPPSAPVKSRKRDIGKQIQHRCITREGLLTSGYVCIALSLRNLNPSLSSPPHYHSDTDISRHRPCHLIQISAWSSVELHYVSSFVIWLFASARKSFTWHAWDRQPLYKLCYFTRLKFPANCVTWEGH